MAPANGAAELGDETNWDSNNASISELRLLPEEEPMSEHWVAFQYVATL